MSRVSESSESSRITFDPDESEQSFELSDSESSFDPQASESEISLDDVPNTASKGMPPPQVKSRAEMAEKVLSRELDKLEKKAIITKYLELNATEENLRRYNRKIILENRELKANIESLLESMTKQNAIIEVLTMTKERTEKEKMDLQSEYAVLKKRDDVLTGKPRLHSSIKLSDGKRVLFNQLTGIYGLTDEKAHEIVEVSSQDRHNIYDLVVTALKDPSNRRGGNNKRIKNVSQRSTASHHHATRRHSSQRKKSGTLRRVRR
jgi:hypothetical protein